MLTQTAMTLRCWSRRWRGRCWWWMTCRGWIGRSGQVFGFRYSVPHVGVV